MSRSSCLSSGVYGKKNREWGGFPLLAQKIESGKSDQCQSIFRSTTISVQWWLCLWR